MRTLRGKTLPPSPVVIYRPSSDGDLVVSEVIKAPVRHWTDEWEPDCFKATLRVMCLQETGEEQFVGHARNPYHAGQLIDNWQKTHIEHHSFWTERI